MPIDKINVLLKQIEELRFEIKAEETQGMMNLTEAFKEEMLISRTLILETFADRMKLIDQALADLVYGEGLLPGS